MRGALRRLTSTGFSVLAELMDRAAWAVSDERPASPPASSPIEQMPTRFHLALEEWAEDPCTHSLLTLWAEIYGRTPDVDRSVADFTSEVDVALAYLDES